MNESQQMKFRNHWAGIAFCVGGWLILLSVLSSSGVDMPTDFGLLLGGAGWVLLALFMKPSFRISRFGDLFEKEGEVARKETRQ